MAISLGQSLAKSLGHSLGQSLGSPDIMQLLTFANASPRYAVNPVTGAVTGPYAAGIPAIITIGGKRFLQVERAAKNVIKQSGNLSVSPWSKSPATDVIIASTVVDPLGGYGAWRFIPSTDSGVHVVYQSTTTNYQTWGLCVRNHGYNYVHLRNGINQAIAINITTGAWTYSVGSGFVRNFATLSCVDGWRYIEFSNNSAAPGNIYEISASPTSAYPSVGNGVDGIDIWQPQGWTENYFYGHSPIMTASAEVTCAKDEAYIPAASVPTALKDKCRIELYPEWSSDQVTTGDERELCEFADTTQNIRCYYDGADKKVKVAGRRKQIATPANAMYGIALNSTDIYYTSFAGHLIQRVSINGGTPTTLISSADPYTGIALDATYMYYFIYSGANAGLYRATLVGSSPTLLTASVNNPKNACMDSTKIYWADAGSGKIKSYTLIGGSVTDEITGLNDPGGCDVDIDRIYLAETGAGKIRSRLLSGGGITDLVTGLTNPRSVVVDTTTLYYTLDDGTVCSAPKLTGTPVTTLSTGVTGSLGIDVNNTNIYVASAVASALSSIYKAPFSSPATTHSARQKLTVDLDRAAGTVTLSNFTTGNGTTVGTPWARTDGNLYIGQDALLANQIDGDIHLETFA